VHEQSLWGFRVGGPGRSGRGFGVEIEVGVFETVLGCRVGLPSCVPDSRDFEAEGVVFAGGHHVQFVGPDFLLVDLGGVFGVGDVSEGEHVWLVLCSWDLADDQGEMGSGW